MAKYYYKDKDGKSKKYVGNVVKRDGKTYGKLVKSQTNYSISELYKVSEHQVVDNEFSYLIWKDKFGVEHQLDPIKDNITNDNKVIDRREYRTVLEYHPSVEEQVYYVDKEGKRYDEAKEIDGKYYKI